jgi:hypothetical protein
MWNLKPKLEQKTLNKILSPTISRMEHSAKIRDLKYDEKALVFI